jgi:hypothetical protein
MIPLRNTISLLAALGFATQPANARAQMHASMDLGSGAIRYASPTSPSLFVGGGFRFDGPRGALWGDGRFTFRGSEATDLQGEVVSMLRSPALGPLTGELTLGAGGIGLAGYPRSTRVDLSLGPSFDWTAYRLTVHGGHSWLRVGGEERGAIRASLQLERRFAAALLTLSGEFTEFAPRNPQGKVFYVAGFPFRSRNQLERGLRQSYLDALAAVRWRFHRLTMDLHAGLRAGTAVGAYEGWGGLSVELPVLSRAALVATGGWQSSVPEQDLPRSRYAMLAVRLSPRSTPASTGDPPAVAGSSELVMAEGENGAPTLLISGLTARRVELMGDFTGWQAVDLLRVGDGEWVLPTPVPEGAHRLCIRVDNGPWRAPPGLPTAPDEFQGQVGVLVVE